MEKFVKTCDRCGKTLLTELFVHTNSKFMDGTGRSPVCIDCLREIVDFYDFASVDEFCRWVNIPFVPNDWVRIHGEYGKDALTEYCKVMAKGIYPGTDWDTMDQLWKQKLNEGTIMEEMEELRNVYLKDMRMKWKMGGSLEKYMALENYYKNMESTRTIVTEAQRDILRKICKIAYAADEAIEEGDPKVIKELTNTYMSMVKQAGLLDEDAIRQNEIDSVGRLFEHMEQNGWMPNFYDGIEMDVIDVTINDIQKTNRRMIMGDNSIAEDVEAKLRKAKLDVEDAFDDELLDAKRTLGLDTQKTSTKASKTTRMKNIPIAKFGDDDD